MTNANESTQACTKCGIQHNHKNARTGEFLDPCLACVRAWMNERRRIRNYYEQNPDVCRCQALGRHSCVAPIHGDMYRASCIEQGERFYTTFRASDGREAMKIGTEIACGWGGECISVRKIKNPQL
jgi:hypothetical protein